jgi:hypothetical protein
MSVTRLSGGLTPGNGADPRTFPAIWNGTADDLEAGDYSKVPTGGVAGEVLAKVSGSDYDTAWVERSYPWTALSGASYGNLGNATTTQSLNACHFVPVYFPLPTDLTHIRAEVTTAGSAGAVIRLGLYEQGSDGFPGNLIVDAGTVSSETTGVKEVTISETVTGLIYMAIVTQGATCTTRASNNVGLAYPASLQSAGNLGLDTRTVPRQDAVSGSLPTPASANTNATPAMAVHVRVA